MTLPTAPGSVVRATTVSTAVVQFENELFVKSDGLDNWTPVASIHSAMRTLAYRADMLLDATVILDMDQETR